MNGLIPQIAYKKPPSSSLDGFFLNKKKSAEAEDIIKKRESITRYRSLPNLLELKGMATEKEAILKKTGIIWECIHRTPDKSGGYIYSFKLKDKFNPCYDTPDDCKKTLALFNKNKEIFPAIEPSIQQILIYSDLNSNSETFDKESLFHFKFLKDLGYESFFKEDQFYFNVPDREALMARFKVLQEKYKELSSLDIASSKSVSGDIEFTEAYLTHDVLLSDGIEFLHDHIIHLAPTILLKLSALSDVTYKKNKFTLVTYLMKFYKSLLINHRVLAENKSEIPLHELKVFKEDLKKVEATLGALVDSISSLPSFEMISEFFLGKQPVINLQTLWENPLWKNYWNKRFGEEADTVNFEAILQKLSEREKEFYKDRKLFFKFSSV